MRYMLRKFSLVLAASAALVACGGGGDPKLKACVDEIKLKLDGKSYQLDEKALAANPADEGDGIVSMSAPIVIQPGMTDEVKQTVKCRVRTVNGATDVISLTFIW